MSKNDLVIRSAILATKEKLSDKFLSAQKIQKADSPSFLFYILEINSPWAASQKVKKTISSILEKENRKEDYNEDDFEQTLGLINENLNKLVGLGDNNWVGNLNAAVGYVFNDQICIAQSGKISGYIFRKGKISSLTDSTSTLSEPHPLKTFSDITTGKLIPDDRVIFGNVELYNHLSLDRLRRIAEDLSAPETILELFKILKKNKNVSTNIIALEAIKTSDLSNETLGELPEIFYLDEPDETIFQKLRKRYGPKINEISKATQKKLAEETHALSKKTKAKLDESKKSWHEYYGPKAKELADKSGPALTKVYDKTKKSVAPEIEKFKKQENCKKFKAKTKLYTDKTKTNSKQISKLLLEFINFIKNLFSKKENKKYLILALVVILFFFGFLKIQANNANQETAKKQQENAIAYDQAKEAYTKAKDDLALGKTSSTENLQNALNLAKKAELDPGSKDKATALTKDIQSSIDKITKTSRIYSTTPVIKLDKDIAKIAISGQSIYAINSDGKIYTAASGDTEVKLIASIGKTNGAIKDLTYSDSENKIYIYTNNKKMIGFDISDNVQNVLNCENDWEDAVAISNFSSNIYLLDSTDGIIWKHTQSDSSYSKGSSALSSKKAGIQNAVDLGIDGNMFVLLSDGTVSKFSKGLNDNDFAIKDIPEPNSKILEPAKIYTDENTNYIYVLDKKLNRIIKFDKSGEFVKQYTLDNSVISDFGINEKLKKMWIASGNKIFETDL